MKRKPTKKRGNQRGGGGAGASDSDYEDEEEGEASSETENKIEKKNKNSKHLYVTHNYRTTPSSSSLPSSSDDHSHSFSTYPVLSPPTNLLLGTFDSEDPNVSGHAKLQKKLSLLEKASLLLKDTIAQSDKGTENFTKYTDLFEINVNKQLELIEQMNQFV